MRGEATELFSVARELDAIVPLRIAAKAKAERGYELIEDAKQTFQKASPVELDASMASSHAFRAIVRNCLRQIIDNEPGVCAGDAEALHQMRIGLRRLRTAIASFAPVSAGSEQDRIKAELKWATKALGPARDLDVFATDVLKHLSETGANEKEFAEVSAISHKDEQKPMPGQQTSSVRTAFAGSCLMSPSGLKSAPGLPGPRLTLTLSNLLPSMPRRFWPNYANASEGREGGWTSSMHGRVTSCGSERRTCDTRSSFLPVSFQVIRTPKGERQR